jgi:hypothetical protein
MDEGDKLRVIMPVLQEIYTARSCTYGLSLQLSQSKYVWRYVTGYSVKVLYFEGHFV